MPRLGRRGCGLHYVRPHVQSSFATSDVLNRYRRVRMRVLVGLAVPAFLLLLSVFAGVVLDWPGAVVALCFGLGFSLSVVAHFSLRCPVCHKLVRDVEGGPNFRAKACAHCGTVLQ